LFYKNASHEANNDEALDANADASLDDETKSITTFHSSPADLLAIKTF